MSTDKSVSDHQDHGRYFIGVEPGRRFLATDAEHWAATIWYKTSTGKDVLIFNDASLPKIMRVDDADKDHAAKEQAYNRLVPLMERHNEYRYVTKQRYEVRREQDADLPIVPEIP